MTKHIDLTTAFNPGDFDTSLTSYPDVKLKDCSIDVGQKVIMTNCLYGEWAASVWTDGMKEIMHRIGGSNYDTIMAVAATASETTENHMERAILLELITLGHFAGTVGDGG